MDSGGPSRRGLLRVVGLTASLGALSTLAGCGLLDDDDSPDNDESSQSTDRAGADFELVPTGAVAVVTADVDQLRDDPNFTDAASLLLDSGGLPAYPSQFPLSVFLETTGLAVSDLSRLVLFLAGYTRDSLGAIIATTRSQSELHESLDETDLETRTEGDTTVYESPQTTCAPLSEGRLAVGSASVVSDVLAVARGDHDVASGPVATAYRSAASGAVQFGFTVPEQTGDGDSDLVSLSDLESGYGSLFLGRPQAEFSASADCTDGESARQLDTILTSVLDELKSPDEMILLTSVLDESTQSSDDDSDINVRLRRAAMNTSVYGSGTTMTLETTGESSALAALAFAANVWSFVPDAGRSRSPTPTASFSFESAPKRDGNIRKLVIRHEDGHMIRAQHLFVRGDFDGGAAGGSWQELGGEASGTIDGEPAVASGDSVTVDAGRGYEVRVIWDDDSQSAVLSVDSGPDA